ncbi:MAG: exopolyphosphatase, partial [Rhizobiaceae bacterium]|nr:exopolyphosphatase [Rhizobiaceae bacterium]
MVESEAQGRLPGIAPVSVVDIGSNSVRLVVYEGHSRSPTVLFNEKVLCGLGKGIALTGKMDEGSVARA